MPLRILLALAFAALLLAQVLFLPALAGAMAEDSPELAYLRWPTLVVAVLGLGCVQVVIVCTWKLLAMVKADRIFSRDAFAWVDAIVWAITSAWVLARDPCQRPSTRVGRKRGVGGGWCIRATLSRSSSQAGAPASHRTSDRDVLARPTCSWLSAHREPGAREVSQDVDRGVP